MKNFFIPDYLTIKGGKSIDSRIKVSGAKNEVLGIMAAAVLTDEVVELRNVPYISDVLEMGSIMMDLGVDVKYSPAENRLRLHARRITGNVLPELALHFRASYYLWGALLARFRVTGEFKSLHIKMPGGCTLVETFKTGEGFGKQGRATDFHFNMLQNVFEVDIKKGAGEDDLELVLPDRSSVEDPHPVYATRLMSHGATMHWMLAAALSERQKFMYNASLEPEVPHLLWILRAMGAELRGTGTMAITNMGHSGGLLKGGVFDVMPDRLEAGTYALLTMALRGKIHIEGANASHCLPWLNLIKEIVKPENDRVRVDDSGMYFDFTGFEFPGQHIIFSPFPGKETDLQQIWTSVLTSATSSSVIVDPVWPKRSDMPKMMPFGVDFDFEQLEIENYEMPLTSRLLIIPSKVRPAESSGFDLRGTMAMIILAVMAEGESKINNPSFALRGYPNLVKNLQAIGIDITASEKGRELACLPE